MVEWLLDISPPNRSASDVSIWNCLELLENVLQGNYIEGIKCSNLYVNSQPRLTTLDYNLDIAKIVRVHEEFRKLETSVLEQWVSLAGVDSISAVQNS